VAEPVSQVLEGEVSNADGVSGAVFVFPGLDVLHSVEESVRGRTKAALAGSIDLHRHFHALTEAMAAITYFAGIYPHTGDDELTIQLLGIRLFNSVAGSVQSLMGGYHQNSVTLLRDVLEVGFLLDYFRSNRERIAEWRNCDERERNKKFSAFHIRTTLDKRDGFTEKKRAAHYELLCKLGAHATYVGFHMLRPSPDAPAICGPHFSERALDAVAFELAKISATQASGHFVRFFAPRSLADHEARLRLMEAQADWFTRFIGPLDNRELDELRALVAQLRRKASESGRDV
jgi:hypothetical protein